MLCRFSFLLCYNLPFRKCLHFVTLFFCCLKGHPFWGDTSEKGWIWIHFGVFWLEDISSLFQRVSTVSQHFSPYAFSPHHANVLFLLFPLSEGNVHCQRCTLDRLFSSLLFCPFSPCHRHGLSFSIQCSFLFLVWFISLKDVIFTAYFSFC